MYFLESMWHQLTLLIYHNSEFQVYIANTTELCTMYGYTGLAPELGIGKLYAVIML